LPNCRRTQSGAINTAANLRPVGEAAEAQSSDLADVDDRCVEADFE
jgi:hypothetical protein